MMKFENPGYLKWGYVEWPEREKWINKISLSDTAVVLIGKSIFEGRIEMINNGGIEVSIEQEIRPRRYKYIYWDKVKEITKRDLGE